LLFNFDFPATTVVERGCAQVSASFRKGFFAVIDIQKRFDRLGQDFDKAWARASRGLSPQQAFTVMLSLATSVAGRAIATVVPAERERAISELRDNVRRMIAAYADAGDTTHNDTVGATTTLH
jgi:hypothetical protein